MRKSLPVILILLTLALAAPYAHADATPYGTYTAECIGFCASDPTVFVIPTVIDFTVFGHTVDFTGLSLTPGDELGWDIDNGKLALTDVTEGNPVTAPVSLSFSTSNEAGLFLPAPLPPAPEPDSITLMLLGLASLFVARKRIGSRISQAS